MSAYLKSQARIAIRTLPWYTLAPVFVVGLPLTILAAFDANPDGYWFLIKVVAIMGFFVWLIRQSIRVLWVIRRVSADNY